MNLFSTAAAFGPSAPYRGGGTGISGIFGGPIPAPHGSLAHAVPAFNFGVPGAPSNVPGLVPGELRNRPGSVQVAS